MPVIEMPHFLKSVACANDLITVDTTTNIWPDQIGFISNSGQITRRFRVTEIQSATVFRIKWYPRINDDNFARVSGVGTADQGYPANASSVTVTAYNGGTAMFPEQQVSAQPDYSKPPSAPTG